MKRPLARPALLFIAGILIGQVTAWPCAVFLIPGFLLCAAAILWVAPRRVLLGLAIVMAGAAALTLQTGRIGPRDPRKVIGDEPRIVAVRGHLVETPFQRYYQDRTRTLTRIAAAEAHFDKMWHPVSGTVAVISPGAAPDHLWAGQQVEVMGVISRPETALAPGLFDYRAFLALQGIHYQLRTAGTMRGDWQIIGGTNAPAGVRFNRWAQRALARGLPREDRALELLWAMTLGWKTALNGEVSEPFMRSGTLHIFAISGLHVTMIAIIVAGVFRLCLVPRRFSGVIVISVLWFYTYATGWQASAVRSSVMTTVFVGSWVLIRPPDVYNSLAAAALIILLADPRQLFQAGFQLSFAVVFGLILCGGAATSWRRRLIAGDPLIPWEVRPWWQQASLRAATVVGGLALTALAASVASAPLIAHYFHLFTPVSVISNLVVVPISGVALACNLAALFFAPWFPAITELANHLAWYCMKVMLWVSEWTARWPGAARHVPKPGLFAILLYYLAFIAAFAGWFSRARLRPWLFGTLGILGVLAAIDVTRRISSTSLTILPLSDGHAIFWDAPGFARDTLIDCGNVGNSQIVLKPFLQSRGVNTLRSVVLTHGDADHTGGFEEISDDFLTRRIVTPAVPFRSPIYREALSAARDRGIPIVQSNPGDMISGWTVLYPATENNAARADDKTLVLSGQINGTRVLLLGDLGRDGQNALVDTTPDLRSDVVVASIPKGSEPLTDALLDRVQPRTIIVADALFPVEARAKPRLRERLARRSVPVFYASESGAITIDFDSTPAKVLPTRTAAINESEPAAPPRSSSEE